MTTDAQTTDAQIRQRMALVARFPAELERRFEGRGGRTFTYVPDESVMDRLDDVFGVGGWSIGVDPMGDRCVRVTLRALGVEYQDFGYSNNAESAEPLKEASGDGLRRCARYIGIARYLYAGDVRPQPVQNGSGRPEPTRVAPMPTPVGPVIVDGRSVGGGSAPMAERAAPLPTRLSEEDAPWPEEIRTIVPTVSLSREKCTIHDHAWLGTAETGYYHKDPAGRWCRAHPDNTPRAAVR